MFHNISFDIWSHFDALLTSVYTLNNTELFFLGIRGGINKTTEKFRILLLLSYGLFADVPKHGRQNFLMAQRESFPGSEV